MSTRPGTSAAAATLRQVLAHVVLTAGVVGGLALALMIALPALAPAALVATAPAPGPAPETGPVTRGSGVLAPAPPDPLPVLAGRVVAGTRAFPVAGDAD